MKRIAGIILAGLVLGFAAQAASFDCGKASTKVEKLICGDAALSKLDKELSAAYKTALQDKKQASTTKQAQKRWMKERNNCVDAGCVKGAYEARLSSLRPVTSAPVAPSAVPDGCNAEDQRDKSNIRAPDIAGLYRQSVEGLPAIIGRPEEKLSGYNYLAITPLAGNRIRVRLSTKEINGHDCGFDSEALLCGRTIRLIPNEEEKAALAVGKQSVPSLRVTANQIAFIPDAEGYFVSGNSYCGNRGSLTQSFKRSTRNLQIDDSVFNQ